MDHKRLDVPPTEAARGPAATPSAWPRCPRPARLPGNADRLAPSRQTAGPARRAWDCGPEGLGSNPSPAAAGKSIGAPSLGSSITSLELAELVRAARAERRRAFGGFRTAWVARAGAYLALLRPPAPAPSLPGRAAPLPPLSWLLPLSAKKSNKASQAPEDHQGAAASVTPPGCLMQVASSYSGLVTLARPALACPAPCWLASRPPLAP